MKRKSLDQYIGMDERGMRRANTNINRVEGMIAFINKSL